MKFTLFWCMFFCLSKTITKHHIKLLKICIIASMNKIVIIIIVVICSGLSMQAQKDIFDKENTKKYADFLFQSNEYSMAAKEYERIIFLDTTDFNAKMKLIISYNKAGNYDRAVYKVNKLFPETLNMPTSIAKEYSISLIRQNDLLSVRSFLNNYNKFNNHDKAFFALSVELFDQNWVKAREVAEQSKDIETLSFLQLASIANQTTDIKYKSPLISSGLSVIVPGLGKAYSGYWKDGLFSLLFTSIAAWQAYRGFNKNGTKSAYGWIYGGIALGFYTGNIYGSYKAANKYNETINHSIYHQIEEVYNNID